MNEPYQSRKRKLITCVADASGGVTIENYPVCANSIMVHIVPAPLRYANERYSY